MKKLILTTVVSFTTTLFAFAQNLAPAKAISFIKQPYSKVKASLIKEGYSFVEKDDEFYIFNKNGFELTIALKQNSVSVISSREAAFQYKQLYAELSKLGFVFIKSSSGETYNAPGSILRFDKERLLSCYVITPANVKSNGFMIVNYGTYSK